MKARDEAVNQIRPLIKTQGPVSQKVLAVLPSGLEDFTDSLILNKTFNV